MEQEPAVFPAWMRGLLILAGIYNLAWGLFIYNFPDSFFKWIVKAEYNTPQLIAYQGLGTTLFGLIYLIAASYPVRFWYLTALGFFSKIIGALGFSILIMDYQYTKTFIFHLVMNDIIWLFPLGAIALNARKINKEKNSSS